MPDPSERNRPGRQGWTPSKEEVSAAEEAHPGLVLRLVSIIPFGLIGAFSVIAIVAWFAAIVFGAGTDRGTLWAWAAGRPVSEVVTQVALAIVPGLIPVALLVLCIWATVRGSSESPALYLRLLTAIVFAAAALALVLGRVQWPEFMESIALNGTEWWFAFVVVAYSMSMAHLRVRRGRRTLAVEDADG